MLPNALYVIYVYVYVCKFVIFGYVFGDGHFAVKCYTNNFYTIRQSNITMAYVSK